MKKLLGAMGLILLAGGIWFAWAFAHGKEPARQALDRGRGQAFVAGEALVQFKPNVSDGEARRLISEAGASVKERIEAMRVYVVSFSQGTPPQEMVERFQKMPQVSHAEPNGIVEASVWDPLLPASAWAEETSAGTLGAGAKIRVAVLDTAIDSNHPALAGKVVPGYNTVNETTQTQSSGAGLDWHGTASAGRVLDGAGDANVEIVPVTVMSAGGSGTWADVIQGIRYAADNGADVINMSLGGAGYSPLVQEAIDYAVSKGVVVVASAGNTYSEQARYPAAYRGVISVAATDESGRKQGFSTYHESVDISGPGQLQKLLNHGGGYRTAQGTSFSAPFIAGLAAMLKSAFPFLKPGQVEQAIKAKAHDAGAMNDPRYAGKLGAGFLNALDVQSWMADIRAGRFGTPWAGGRVVAPAPQPPRPQPQPAQPWLVRGRGNSGSYIVTPAGEVVKE